MSPPPPQSTRAAPLPPDERRAAIVAAAAPLVCDHGAAVTTREIAEAAGIAEGTIFRVFPDKDAVISAVLASILDPAPLVCELRTIDPHTNLRQVLNGAVNAMRRQIDSVWQIMWMLRISGPPGQSDTSRFGVINPPGSAAAHHHPPDLTEAANALTDLLHPHRDELRVPPAEAARLFRLITFAGAHPRITDGQPLSTTEIVDLLLHGIGSARSTGAKTTSEQSLPAEDSPGNPPPRGHQHDTVSHSLPVGAR